MDDHCVAEGCPRRTVLWFEVILCVGAMESPGGGELGLVVAVLLVGVVAV